MAWLGFADAVNGSWLPGRLRNFAARSLFQQLWFLPAWIGLGLASLAIAIVPFRHIAPRLGKHAGLEQPEMDIGAAQAARAREIRRTVQLAAHFAPWRADCYPQAIVARALLGIYGLPFALCMGLRNDPLSGQVQAHAWIRCGEICVTGDAEENTYRVVGVFTQV